MYQVFVRFPKQATSQVCVRLEPPISHVAGLGFRECNLAPFFSFFESSSQDSFRLRRPYGRRPKMRVEVSFHVHSVVFVLALPFESKYPFLSLDRHFRFFLFLFFPTFSHFCLAMCGSAFVALILLAS